MPTTSALLPLASKPLRATPRVNPAPSNWSPSSDPSSRSSTALDAPATWAIGVSSSTSSVVVTLCGMVTSAPRMFDILNSSGKNSRYSSGLTPIGTTTASMSFFSNHGL